MAIRILVNALRLSIACLATVASSPTSWSRVPPAARVEPSAGAEAAYDAGDYGPALAKLEAELEACRTRRGAAPDACFDLLSWVADTALMADRLDVAERESLHYLDAATRVLGETSVDRAVAANALSSTYSHLGRMADAERYQLLSIAIKRRLIPVDERGLAIAFSNYGVLLDRAGRYREAEPWYRDAMAKVDRLDPADPDLAATMRTNVARNLDNQGRLEESLAMSKQALAIRRRIQKPDHPSIAIGLNNVALTLMRLGRLDEAEVAIREAYAIRLSKTAPRDRDMLMTQIAYAALLERIGRFADARTLLETNIASWRAIGERVRLPYALIPSGRVLDTLGDHVAAQARLREAIAIEAASERPSADLIARAEAALAKSLLDSADATGAEIAARSAIARRGGAGSNRYDVAATIMLLGDVQLARQKPGDALASYRQALAIDERVLAANHPDIIDIRTRIARLLADTPGGEADARRWYAETAVLARERIAINILAAPTDDQLKDADRSLFLDQLRLLNRAAANGGDTAALMDEAFVAGQSAQQSTAARALRRLAARRTGGGVNEANGAIGAIEAQRQQLLRRISGDERKSLGLPAGEEATAVARSMANARSEFARLTAQLRAEHPDYLAAIVPQPLALAEARARLARDAALLFAIPSPEGYHVWMVTHDDVRHILIEDRDVARFSDHVDAIRAAVGPDEGARGSLAGRARDRFPTASAEWLGTTLFAPFADLIAGKRQLYVVAAGPLARIPLAVLRYRHRWLVDRLAIASLPSVDSLRAVRQIAASAPTEARTVVALGLVDPGAAGAGLPVLHQVDRQLRELERLFGDRAVIREGTAATEQWLAADPVPRAAGVLVFATHSVVRGGEEPALLLAPDNAGGDGLLTVSEASTLRLSADLVVLTACDTATPLATDPDPLASFARAFFLAGAQSALVSHWPLDDGAAASQMNYFFKALRASPDRSRAELLRRSMIALRNTPGGRWRHPRYWAPLALVGN